MRINNNLRNYAAVFGGGCLGGVARYGVNLALHDASTLLGTTSVNILGSFLLAFITYGLAQRLSLPNWLILALGTGFVGAFTTFSILTSEFIVTAAANPLRAGIFMIANLGGGLLMGSLGLLAARKWVRA